VNNDAVAVSEPPATSSRGDCREQAILDTALDLIGEVGYERMSMDALAARARASKATIYRRWPGKAQVVAEAIRRRACPAMAETPDTGTLRGDLLAALRAQRDILAGQDCPLFTGLMMASRDDEELGSLLRAQMGADKQRVAAVLFDRAAARGEVDPAAEPALIQELVPALLFMRLMITGEPTDDVYLVHIVDDVLLPLLAGCPSCRGPAAG
jgi:AcrR family transcriptional regulator